MVVLALALAVDVLKSNAWGTGEGKERWRLGAAEAIRCSREGTCGCEFKLLLNWLIASCCGGDTRGAVVGASGAGGSWSLLSSAVGATRDMIRDLLSEKEW